MKTLLLGLFLFSTMSAFAEIGPKTKLAIENRYDRCKVVPSVEGFNQLWVDNAIFDTYALTSEDASLEKAIASLVKFGTCELKEYQGDFELIGKAVANRFAECKVKILHPALMQLFVRGDFAGNYNEEEKLEKKLADLLDKEVCREKRYLGGVQYIDEILSGKYSNCTIVFDNGYFFFKANNRFKGQYVIQKENEKLNNVILKSIESGVCI